MSVEKKKVNEESEEKGLTLQEQRDLMKTVSEMKAKLDSENKGGDTESIKELVKELINVNKDDKYEEYNSDGYSKDQTAGFEDLLPEDEHVTFIAHKVGYVIVDKLVNKRMIKAPLGKIEFKYEATKQVKSGKETDIFNFCTYTCKSKKEKAWLLSHPLYETMFFSNMNAALGADAKKAAKLARLMTTLSNVGQNELNKMARARGLAILNNPQELRASIASNMADEQMKREESQNLVRLKEKAIEEKMLKS